MTDAVGCPACAGGNVFGVERWPMGGRAQAMACRDCGLLFTHPQPVRETARPADPPGGGPDAPAEPATSIGLVRNKAAAGALMTALDRFFPAREPAHGARVLDYGCGAGAWLNAFQYCGWETFGIEWSTDAAFARHARITSIPAEPRFDLVILYQALQKLPRPLATLRELAAALHAGGHMLVSVPRLDMLAVHKDVAACLGPRKHIVAFTEACLRGLLARAGLEVVASLHDLDDAFSHGAPLRLRLLARKVDGVVPECGAAAALEPVFDALADIESAAAATDAPAAIREPAACPACSTTQVRVLEEWPLAKNSAWAAACLECGLLFAWPQPSQQELDALYTTDDYREWKASRLTDTAWKTEDERSGAGLTPKKRRRTPAIFTALEPFLPTTRPAAGARVFDFGCGPGTWLDAFQDHGWETYGLEPCTNAAFARHRQLLAVPAEEQFDLVFVYHVLEHLPRPLETLNDLAPAIRTGGHLFVSVPRLDTLALHGEPKYCLCPPHHIVAFTEACMRGLLARVGLGVVAAFHDSPSAIKAGLPTKLQLLARKMAAPPPRESDPAAALTPVIEAYRAIRRRKYQRPDSGVTDSMKTL